MPIHPSDPLVGTFSERPENDHELEQLRRLARIAQASGDGLWECDLRSDRTWLSVQAENSLGGLVRSDKPFQQSWFQLVHPDDQAAVCEAIAAHVAGGPRMDIQFRILNREGKERWFRAKAGCIRDATGRACYLAGNLQDIDRHRRMAEKQRLQEQHLTRHHRLGVMGQMAAGMAHEFSNLLQIIGGYATFARDALPAETESHKDLNQTLTAVQQAVELTHQLLKFCRADASDSVVVDVRGLLEELVVLLRPVLGEHVMLDLRISERPLSVEVDPSSLQLALLNLCLNARDAMPLGGHLLLRSELIELDAIAAQQLGQMQSGSYVCLAVTDTGRGIPHEIRSRVYEPFFTTKSSSQGTGLGLSLVHGLARQYHGHLNFWSELEVGTTFRLFLPASETPMSDRECLAASDTANHNAIDSAELANLRVLVVQGNPCLEGDAAPLLTSLGAVVQNVTRIEDVTTVLAAATPPFDVLLVDEKVPHRQIPHLVTRLNTIVGVPPVVLCTGFDIASKAACQLASLAAGVIAMPCSQRRLLVVMKQLRLGPASRSGPAIAKKPQD